MVNLQLMDDSHIICFGKHQGKKLKDIPISYFMWLIQQESFMKSQDSYNVKLKIYINVRKKKIKTENR